MNEKDIDMQAAAPEAAETPNNQDVQTEAAAQEADATQEEAGAQEEAGVQAPAEKTDAEKLAEAEATIAALRDQMLRQMAEFDNFRKRTIKEKAELILSGGSRVLESLLPVMDDLERAQDNMAKASDVETLREGVDLIMQKLMKTLEANGLKKMDPRGVAFDTDFHEAIALTPAADEAQKNHVIDCVQAGYMLNDKVLRHAKVVVAQ
ncbi:MAG: nucleotide exchange factor GrpE [Bacteroidales bacterium]|nr:nucleotide exchange factor GrpE [Bacteroidales bacterium]MCI6253072.1 nucleotide exchange factor GrpE [Bacteroidales bacterium]